MNKKFVDKLNDSGLTMYALSKRSGVPYTTINELCKGKTSIDKCAASTVCKIANALCVYPEDIVEDIHYLNGQTGKYRGIQYTWGYDSETYIAFDHRGNHVKLSTGATYDIPEYYDYYVTIAKWMIKEYLERESWESDVDRYFKKANAPD